MVSVVHRCAYPNARPFAIVYATLGVLARSAASTAFEAFVIMLLVRRETERRRAMTAPELTTNFFRNTKKKNKDTPE